MQVFLLYCSSRSVCFWAEKVVMHQHSIACSVHFRHRISPCLSKAMQLKKEILITVRVTNILRLDDNDVSKLSLLFCSHMHHPWQSKMSIKKTASLVTNVKFLVANFLTFLFFSILNQDWLHATILEIRQHSFVSNAPQYPGSSKFALVHK